MRDETIIASIGTSCKKMKSIQDELEIKVQEYLKNGGKITQLESYDRTPDLPAKEYLRGKSIATKQFNRGEKL